MADSSLLIHLSDLHYGRSNNPAPMRESLLDALRQVVDARHQRIAVCVTGDLVDSARIPPEQVASIFRSFVSDLRQVVGDAPIVLLPGNHDRRGDGVFAPWSHDAMRHLEGALADDPRVFVHAADRNEALACAVPELSQVLGARVVAYDSTHATDGRFSAGGLFRTEDLLGVPGVVGSKEPLVVLIHHHLVPTPVADFARVDGATAMKRLFTQQLLPRLVSFADREELFMTALGSGTALTVLHALGSACLVLHGHKHYPTARLLRATQEGDGDVLLASAGSAGLREPYQESGLTKTFLWPSFNTLTFEGGRIEVDTIWFSPDETRPIARQPLARVIQRGASWDSEAVPAAHQFDLKTDLDQAEYQLEKSAPGYWDYRCRRTVQARGIHAYRETVEALPHSHSHVQGEGVVMTRRGRFFVLVHPGETNYRAERALCRTVEEARRQYKEEDFSPFECVTLHVRKGTKRARLVVRGLPKAENIAFGTVTDLHTGQQRPMPVTPVDGGVEMVMPSCPGRRLLRLCWPLER